MILPARCAISSVREYSFIPYIDTGEECSVFGTKTIYFFIFFGLASRHGVRCWSRQLPEDSYQYSSSRARSQRSILVRDQRTGGLVHWCSDTFPLGEYLRDV